MRKTTEMLEICKRIEKLIQTRTGARSSNTYSHAADIEHVGFDGLRGETPVRVKVRLDAGCFRPGAACAHINYEFYEVE